jgi:hypothetical protein
MHRERARGWLILNPSSLVVFVLISRVVCGERAQSSGFRQVGC